MVHNAKFLDSLVVKSIKNTGKVTVSLFLLLPRVLHYTIHFSLTRFKKSFKFDGKFI